jgi:hypothetical protein
LFEQAGFSFLYETKDVTMKTTDLAKGDILLYKLKIQLILTAINQ